MDAVTPAAAAGNGARPTDRDRLRATGLALLLLAAASPALSAASARAPQPGQPATASADPQTVMLVVASTPTLASDAAAVVLGVCGLLTFVYARRRNLRMQGERCTSQDVTRRAREGGSRHGTRQPPFAANTRWPEADGEAAASSASGPANDTDSRHRTAPPATVTTNGSHESESVWRVAGQSGHRLQSDATVHAEQASPGLPAVETPER